MTQLTMDKEASFLLTEIALDLLSNKFYDISGQQVKDLQSLFKKKSDSDDYLEDEKNLAEILTLPSELSNDSIKIGSSLDNSSNIEKDIFNPDEQPIEIDALLQYNDDSQSSDISMDSENFDESSLKQEEENNLYFQYNPEPDIMLLTSKLQEDRVQYIIDWTKYEFRKILDKSQKLKADNEYLYQNLKNLKSIQKEFRQKERDQLEHESEQLISLIKIIKKSEFSLTKKECAGMLSQISGDIMTSKSKICSDPSVCI